MTDKYIEKSFLYLFLVSLLLHLGVFALVLYLPGAKQPPPREPVFIDLQQMPELPPRQEPRQMKTPRLSDQQRRVNRETAPRSRDNRDSEVSRAPREPVRSAPRQQPNEPGPAGPSQSPAQDNTALPLPSERPIRQVLPGSSASSLLKPRNQGVQRPSQEQLFPKATKLAQLEENYRRKFENDVTEGDTKFLNTDDIQFGSFLRRFENAVYGVWSYPQEAVRNGIEGITPVKITFSREGKVVRVQLLESSGARILDDEVIRTLNTIGPVGTFPKGYDKDEFHVIAFFNYGISRKSLR